jgi:histidyl-tRNA synthetase
LKGETLKISQLLREAGIPAELEVMGRKMNKALEDADRRKLDYAIIVGERELKHNSVVLRDLAKREQIVVEIPKLAKTILAE